MLPPNKLTLQPPRRQTLKRSSPQSLDNLGKRPLRPPLWDPDHNPEILKGTCSAGTDRHMSMWSLWLVRQ